MPLTPMLPLPRYAFLIVFLASLILGGCETGTPAQQANPSVYLLNHNHWTPLLVLNFAQEVAPFDGIDKPLANPPQIDPPINGEWRWQDPSRLAFFPANQSLRPDTRMSIHLEAVKLREGYKPPTLLTYRTPPLKLVKQECRWQTEGMAPVQRRFEASLDFNYPVAKLAGSAVIDGKAPVNLFFGSGSHVSITSEAMVRPAQDGKLAFKLDEAALTIQDKSAEGNLIAGPSAELDGGMECELPSLRAGWDPAPAAQPAASGIGLALEDGKIAVRLEGSDLAPSVTRLAAGKEVKTGVSLKPEIAGSWRYGESDEGADLIFTPQKPELLAPGTRFDVAVEAAAFPKVQFAQPNLTATLTTPVMAGSIDSIELYADPADPKIKRVAAKLSTTYPPEKGSLESRLAVQLRVEPAKTFDDRRVQSVPFELSYDAKDPRVAYLKSAPVAIAEHPSEARVTLGAGVVAVIGGAPSKGEVGQSLAIPSARDYFTVSSVETQSVVKADGDLERVLIVQTKQPLKDPSAMAQAVEIRLLPDCSPDNPERPAFCEERQIQSWQSADQVDAAVLKASTTLTATWQGVSEDDRTVHRLVFSAPEKRQLFARVKKGIESVDGFHLAEDARYLLETGANQREIKILHNGALLSLTGTKKLGVAVRGVDKVHVRLQRVLPHNMHHLAQFTGGDFQNPDFKLPITHFAETLGYDETLPEGKEMERQYFAVDFSRFIKDKGFPPRGLFLLTVSEPKADEQKSEDPCNPDDESEESCESASSEVDDLYPGEQPEDSEETETDAETSGLHDKRLVLLTDLGLLVKTAQDGRQDVFVMSFRSGQPVAGADVWLLGKNGAPVASGKTNADGRATLPSVEGLKLEKTPAVYLAEKDGDMSFLPYARSNRLMDVSRFDIDGLRDTADSLHAYLFSDRGIYRPGDTAHIGLMLRKRDWTALPPGLPLKAVITDPEDREVFSRTVAFGAEGFETLDFETIASGKTGTYRAELFIGGTKEGEKKKSLGHTTIRVEEFQPDRLQVKTDIPALPANGWLAPAGAKAKVTVRNLFGTAAEGSTAKLEMTARPWNGTVPAFPDFRFRGTGADLPTSPQDLGQATTDAKGEAVFDLPLESIAEPVFEIALAGEGFEKDSGRSVVNVATALVSKQPFLLGQAADGNLDYISKNSARSLKLIALGADYKPREVPELAYEVYESRYASTLVKRDDGLFAYQSVKREEKRKADKLALSGGKGAVTLPTDQPGDFFIVFKTPQGEELNRVAYSVAGDGNVSRSVERNAELQLTLSKKEYAPGEEVEVQIVAPYQGAGLITVEQNGVLASKWIKTTTTASTQRIALPKDTLGNAYLSVAFVRSLDSPEIYMSPLSYGVASFSVSRRAYTQEVELKVPETVRSGTTLDVSYRVNEPTRLVLYAVDEGILQFARYKNPAPLDFFFRKRALQTRTHQILDLILPDYALVNRLSRTGGDEDAEDAAGKYKNPFARKTKPPVVFWSGILNAEAGEHTLSVPVPDYFNGSLRILAVASNAGKLAAASAKTVARNPYVIQPQQPLAVAPGDEFDMGVLVANTTGEPGDKNLEISVAADQSLQLLTPNPQKLTLAPNKDGTVRFRAKALEKLGPVEVRYRVADGKQEAGYGEEMSIRPAQPLMTTLQNGVLKVDDQKSGKPAKLTVQRNVFPEQRRAEVSVSPTPAAYLRGIVDYLKTYPYGCTEQLASQAFPTVVLGANPELGLSAADADKFFARTLRTLIARQRFDGSFAVWAPGSDADPYFSMYATHLLIEARERGFAVPEGVYDRALEYADKLAQESHYDWPHHQAQAYAYYLMARNGATLTERLRAFEANLQSQWGEGGAKANRVRFFLGAAYKLHQLDGDADRFFGEFQRLWQKTGQLPWSIQGNPEDLSLYLYLANKHFPDLVDPKNPQFGRYLQELGQDLVQQRVNSFRGSWAVLGLGSLWSRFQNDAAQTFQLSALTPKGAPSLLELTGKIVRRTLLEAPVQSVELKGKGEWNLYYQLAEQGYDRKPPSEPIAQHLAITRSLSNERGETAETLKLEDKLRIRLALRPDRPMQDVAVVMLIPGGFEIDLSDEGLGARKSLPIGDKPLWEPEYIDVQEDRVVFFGDLTEGEKYFEFRLKPLNTGTYTVPPVFAEGMYDTEVLFRGMGGSVRVVE